MWRCVSCSFCLVCPFLYFSLFTFCILCFIFLLCFPSSLCFLSSSLRWVTQFVVALCFLFALCLCLSVYSLFSSLILPFLCSVFTVWSSSLLSFLFFASSLYLVRCFCIIVHVPPLFLSLHLLLSPSCFPRLAFFFFAFLSLSFASSVPFVRCGVIHLVRFVSVLWFMFSSFLPSLFCFPRLTFSAFLPLSLRSVSSARFSVWFLILSECLSRC